MSATMVAGGEKAVPAAVSSVQDIPLERHPRIQQQPAPGFR